MSFPLLFSLIALIISIGCFAFLMFLFKRYNSQLETIVSQSNSLSEQGKKVNTFNDELHEIRSGNFGVINRVKELVLQVDELQSAQQKLVEQEPQNRFYSKGTKLIGQGASLEEVMRECDMPLAEAELLFNLHNRQK